MTVQAFVNSTLKLIGVLDSGESPSTTESDDALNVLNQLISSWSAAGAPVYSLTKQTVTLTGLSEYLLPARPLKIRSAAVIASGGIAQDLQQYSAEQWTTIRDRQRTGALAEVFFYDGAYPSGTIRIWPIPTAGSLELWTIQQLAPFSSLSQNISLPPGYEQALRFALAQALAPEYGAVLTPEIATGAAEAKTAIAQLNMQVLGGAPAAAPAVAAQ